MSNPGPGQLLFNFVRFWSRRPATGDSTTTEQGRLVLATDAVASVIDRGQSATVSAVAGEIGIDQSGASRLVASAVDAGYLATTIARSDARKREVLVTSSGHVVLQETHAWQERVFDALTTGWSQLRREDFLTSMADLMRRSHPMTVESPDGARSGVTGSADSIAGTGASTADEWLDAAEAAERVGCSVWTIRRWIREGKLSAWKRVASGSDGRRAVKSFVRRSDLDRVIGLDDHTGHAHRIREGAVILNDCQTEALRQVFTDHLIDREHVRSQDPGA